MHALNVGFVLIDAGVICYSCVPVLISLSVIDSLLKIFKTEVS